MTRHKGRRGTGTDSTKARGPGSRVGAGSSERSDDPGPGHLANGCSTESFFETISLMVGRPFTALTIACLVAS
jgi:hypothetical protein